MNNLLRSGVVCVGISLLGLPAGAHVNNNKERIEVAFVLDTTGSMGSLIKGAKKKIWAIANTIIDINPDADVHMALIGYRDFGDAYVTRTFKMSRDIQGLYGNLLQFKAAGGGDNPEAVNEALDASINKIKWSSLKSTRRIVFLVGDAPPHMDYANGPKYPTILSDARKAGIVVNTVQAGTSRTTRQIWKDIAQRGGGSYIPIPQDGGTIVVIETPFDAEIVILQNQIDRTVVPYGSLEQQALVAGKLRSKSSAESSVKIDNSKFYSKRKFAKEVITGRGDLLGDIRNGRIELEKIRVRDLPKELQGKTKSERKSYVRQRLAGRKSLELKMRDLISKRDKYVSAKSAADTGGSRKDSFSKAVARTLKLQLK